MNLHPLNICLSYSGTSKIVHNVSEYHDVEVQFWSDELVPKPPEDVCMFCAFIFVMEYVHCVYEYVLVIRVLLI